MAHSSTEGLPADVAGPHPGRFRVGRAFYTEQHIQQALAAMHTNQIQEIKNRLTGIDWIDRVRIAMLMPTRTFNSAVVYFLKYRLVHHHDDNDVRDVAAGALFLAAKSEDTLAKSRDIVCAAINLDQSPTSQYTPDDPLFDGPSKVVILIENEMLQACGYHFQNRQPETVLKLFWSFSSLTTQDSYELAWDVCLDLYYTWTPIKQTTATMALASVQVVMYLSGINPEAVGMDDDFYKRFRTSRLQLLETLLDLLDLYTEHRSETRVGKITPIEHFIAIAIKLNREAKTKNLPRYCHWKTKAELKLIAAEEAKLEGPTGVKARTGVRSKDVNPANGTVRFLMDMKEGVVEHSKLMEFFGPDTKETVPQKVQEDHLAEEALLNKLNLNDLDVEMKDSDPVHYEDYKSPPTEDEDEWKKTTFSSGGATGNPTPSASSSPDVMTELMKALSGQGST